MVAAPILLPKFVVRLVVLQRKCVVLFGFPGDALSTVW
jgi:hypothetical protein